MSRADMHKILSRQPGDLGEKHTHPRVNDYTLPTCDRQGMGACIYLTIHAIGGCLTLRFTPAAAML